MRWRIRDITLFTFLINLIVVIHFFGANNVKIITKDTLVVLNSNVNVYKTWDKNSPVIKTLDMLDVVKIKKEKIINYRIEITLEDGNNGWINVNDVSYIRNLRWKILKVYGLELFLPIDLKFNLKKDILPECAVGKLKELKLLGGKYFIYVGYFEGKEVFDINRQAEAADAEVESFKSLHYYGYESYYREYYDEEGNLSFGMYIVKSNRKDIYWVSIHLKKQNPPPEEELIAKKILFSVRIKP